MNGIVFVDKDEGWTSHDAVAKTRRVFGTRRVGHAGTLDPMATGLLTLGVGPATRLLTHLVGLDKTYRATIRLGERTLSDDRMSDITFVAPEGAVAGLTAEQIREEMAKLTGPIEQVPSQVSAIKVDGKRAYERVRAGEAIELKKRPVTIHAFEVEAMRPGHALNPVLDLDVTVHCSSGTYVRALARDLGEALGVGGHLTALRRTAVGPFALADHPGDRVWPVEAIRSGSLAGLTEPPALTSPADIASALFPVLNLTDAETIDLGHGKRFHTQHEDAPLVAALSPDRRLIGLVSITDAEVRAVTNFPQHEETT